MAPVLASKVALVGLALVMFWILAAIFAPVLTPYSPLEQDADAMNAGPSAKHPLGADHLGRDLWARLVYGSRLILVLAPLSVLCSLAVGTTFGLMAGYFARPASPGWCAV
jgi:peptide/nickel transport system permease protein